MLRNRPIQHSRPSRARHASKFLAAGAIVAAGVGGVATAAPASAAGESYSTTLSSWSSADFVLKDAKQTKLTVSVGVDQVGVVGKTLTTTKTAAIKLDQSYCQVVSGKDVLITRSLANETPVSTGVKVSPLQGTASVTATVPVSGTETQTPAGTGGDCNEPNPAGAVTSPISESAKVDVKWSNAASSSPIYWSNIWEGAVFYYRDATASGKLGTTNVGKPTSGWLWSGAWVYPTGT